MSQLDLNQFQYENILISLQFTLDALNNLNDTMKLVHDELLKFNKKSEKYEPRMSRRYVHKDKGI